MSLVKGAALGGSIEKPVKSALLSQTGYVGYDHYGFRKLGGDNLEKDQLVFNLDRMRQVCFALWRVNDFAQWVVDIQAAFVMGDGFTYEANEEAVYEVIDEFWTHSANDLDTYLEQHYKELMIYGTLLITKNVSEFSGQVYLGYIDPVMIDRIVTDPENVKIKIGVTLKHYEECQRSYRVVMDKDMESVLSPTAVALREAMTHGEVYVLTINNVTNEPEGVSDLYNLADKFQVLETYLADFGAKLPQLNSFIWDVKVEGANGEELAGYESSFNSKPGSSFFHNENVEMEAVTPDLKSEDADTASRVLRMPILGKFSLSPNWYADPEGTNRASALEAGSPFYKLMNAKQRLYKKFVQFIIQDVVNGKVEMGMLSGDDLSFTLNAPELSKRDLEGISKTVDIMITSVLKNLATDIIDMQTARSMIAFMYEMIGFEMDINKIEEMIAEQAIDDEVQDYRDDRDNDNLNNRIDRIGQAS